MDVETEAVERICLSYESMQVSANNSDKIREKLLLVFKTPM